MMKNYFLLIFLLLLVGKANAQQKATIVINSSPGNEISYWPVGKGNLSYFMLGTKEKADTNGQFIHEFNISQPTEVAVYAGGKEYFALYLTPASKDTITVTKETLTFSGTNAAYNQCLQEVNAYLSYCNKLFYMGEPHELKGVTSLTQYHKLADARMNKALDYVKASGLNNDFIDEQITHIDYIHRTIFLYMALYGLKEENLTKEWYKELEDIINLPLDSKHFLSFRGLGFFLDNLVTAQFIKLEKGKVSDVKDPKTFLFERYKKLLSGDNLQHAWAFYIYNDIAQEEKSIVLAELYERFKKEFPGNPYLPILEPGITENIRYNNSALNEKSQHILSCDSTITCLEDAVKPFKGKVVYIDVWATWCGPCKAMFKHVPALKEKTKDMDIVYLYISIDRPKQREHWKKAIAYYNLKGYHLLVNEKLGQSLYTELGEGERNILSIPHFVIIDKEGKIAVRRAAAPDDPEKLLEQLEQCSKQQK